MPPVQSLCGYCSAIPLGSDSSFQGAPPKWNLGTLERVRRSSTSCPFCLLLLCLPFGSHDPVIKLREFEQAPSYTNSGDAISSSKFLELRLDAFDFFQRNRPALSPFYLSGLREVWLCGVGQGPASLETGSGASQRIHRYTPWGLQPSLGDKIDVSRVSRWISSCEASHHCPPCVLPPETSSTFFPGSFFPGLEVARFLDLQDWRVVELNTTPQYVALSYIWGHVPTINLTTVNKQAIMQPGALRAAWKHLPRTIRDAMILVPKLGVRYLWVDALCLVQNDKEDLELGVEVMDMIYERAWLTIIAAEGHNANAGLPGVQEGSRLATPTARVNVTDNVSIGVYTALDRLLRASSYATRAWTFQEQLLSRRALYFINNAVFFRCRSGEASEHLVDELNIPPRQHTMTGDKEHVITTAPKPLPSVVNTYATWEVKPLVSDMIFYYSQRMLTNKNDVLRAFAGITRRLATLLDCRFIYGLPNLYLEHFLSFTSCKCILRRRTGFPSYSWAGWEGTVEYDPQFSLAETWVLWHERTPSGKFDSLYKSKDITGRRVDIFKALSIVPSPTAPTGLPPNKRLSSSDKQFSPKFWTRPANQKEPDYEYPSYSLLQFWTVSMHYRLEIIDVFRGLARVLATNGEKVGEIYLDGVNDSKFFTSHQAFEFIILGFQYGRYVVMLLEWQWPIAERRGLGWIQQESGYSLPGCLPPGPRWKEIILG